MKKLHKSCLKYDKWKSKNQPENKPWINPELIKVPKIDWNDIAAIDLNNIVKIDESNINEAEVEKNDDDED